MERTLAFFTHYNCNPITVQNHIPLPFNNQISSDTKVFLKIWKLLSAVVEVIFPRIISALSEVYLSGVCLMKIFNTSEYNTSFHTLISGFCFHSLKGK